MIKSKTTRVLELEQSQHASDLKKDYCSCRCHIQRLDFRLLKDSTIIRFAEIMQEQMGETYCKELQERIENRPKCTCTCKH